MIPSLHIHLLGDFLLTADDSPVTTLHVPRLQSLLAYLVLHRDSPQERSHLAFLLWPDSTEAQAHVNLRKALHHLRQALPPIDHFLSVDRQSLHWQPSRPDASWTLDVQDFEQALLCAEQARQAQSSTRQRQALERAVDLYRGDLLPGCYDEWILPERDRVRQLFFSASERFMLLLEVERDYDSAIAAAQHLLRCDPLQETTYRHLMRFYALRGDRAASLRIYHSCATTLERELAVEPSEATRQVYESLMHSDASNRSRTGPLSSRGAEAPLVGRKQEWEHLQAIWRRAASGSSQMIMLAGEAGIGKTRLAEEMVAWVSRQGMSTASAHCYAAEGRLPYAPVTAWLRADVVQASLSALDDIWLTEVARLVPDLLTKRPDLPRPTPMTEGWQRQHFFEALARALLSARQPLLLLLDDLQWCDNETLEWIHYLLHFEPGARLLLVGTVRSEEALAGHPVVAFLAALQREGLVAEVALRPLVMTETTSLAEHIVGHQLDSSTLNSLYNETEGNPLFVVEMVRAASLQDGLREGDVERPLSLLAQPASKLPPTMQTVLTTRFAQLSPLAREIANVAAVIGREFTFAVLLRAGKESEDAVVQGLDELWQRRMVREQDTGTSEAYDFSHSKLREMAYASLSPAHRRLLHRRVAEALEAVYADALSGEQGKLDAISGQIAAQYERAGLPGQAIPYYRRAGEVAMHIYANAEAIAAFQQAAALLEADSSFQPRQGPQWEIAVQIYTSLGDIFVITGRYPEARQAYQRAMAHVPPREPLFTQNNNAAPGTDPGLSQLDKMYIWQARLLRKTASTWNHASDNPLDTFHVNARHAFEQAEHTLEQAEARSSTEWLQEWIALQIDQLLPLRGTVDEMTAIIEKARPVVEQYGTAEQRGQFFQARAARDFARDRYVVSGEVVSYCRAALAEVQQTGNKNLIGYAHFVLGIRLLWSGSLDEAQEEMYAVLHIAEQVGNTNLLARCLTFLPFVFRRRGQVEEVRSVITRALAVPEARNIAIIKGHRAWIAWRDGSFVEAEALGRASLENRPSQQNVNPFQWAGIWPLIGVALVQEKFPEAMDYVRKLLDPSQQPPPATVGALIEAALQAWDVGQQEEARALFQQAVPLAKEMGYL